MRDSPQIAGATAGRNAAVPSPDPGWLKQPTRGIVFTDRARRNGVTHLPPGGWGADAATPIAPANAGAARNAVFNDSRVDLSFGLSPHGTLTPGTAGRAPGAGPETGGPCPKHSERPSVLPGCGISRSDIIRRENVGPRPASFRRDRRRQARHPAQPRWPCTRMILVRGARPGRRQGAGRGHGRRFAPLPGGRRRGWFRRLRARRLVPGLVALLAAFVIWLGWSVGHATHLCRRRDGVGSACGATTGGPLSHPGVRSSKTHVGEPPQDRREAVVSC